MTILIKPGLTEAQVALDTLKLMTYNVNNYGFAATSDCPLQLTDVKHHYLRTILQYINPDILAIEKVNAAPASFISDSVIDYVLDNVCPSCYSHTPYTNNSGYTKTNMLYYKTEKFAWVSTTTIYSKDASIEDINLHRLYYKSADLASSHDTIFLNIIVAHLQSGSGSSKQRGTEIAGAMTYLSAHVKTPGNYFFMGDLNTQSSSETCFQDLIAATNVNVRFYDPANQLGNWAASPTFFANYLTQSTRNIDIGDCGSDNGMGFRFDHLLCTQPVLQGTEKVQYIPGSFTVIGQDGKHTTRYLIDTPANTSVPSPVLNALYYMSEHLPVSLLLQIGGSPATAIKNIEGAPLISVFPNPAEETINVYFGTSTENDCRLAIINLMGEIVWQKEMEITQLQNTLTIPVSNLHAGMYFLQSTGKNRNTVCSFIKQ